jgi:hypothetical protein
VKLTLLPLLGAKQINPRKEAAFRYEPQLKRTNSPSSCEPVISCEAVDAGPQAQLGRGHQLGVQPADVADDADEIRCCSPFDQPMALHPPRERLLPRRHA